MLPPPWSILRYANPEIRRPIGVNLRSYRPETGSSAMSFTLTGVENFGLAASYLRNRKPEVCGETKTYIKLSAWCMRYKKRTAIIEHYEGSLSMLFHNEN